MINILIVLGVVSLVFLPFIDFKKKTKTDKEKKIEQKFDDIANGNPKRKIRTVGAKAIPLVWVHQDKLFKKSKSDDVSIYGFYYNPSKKTVYGIRHWQGWEQIGYTQIPLSQLRLNDDFEYQKMGLLVDKHQVSYKENGPTAIVVGWVFMPSKGVCAVYWNEKTSKFGTIKAELLLDTEDPQYYYKC